MHDVIFRDTQNAFSVSMPDNSNVNIDHMDIVLAPKAPDRHANIALGIGIGGQNASLSIDNTSVDAGDQLGIVISSGDGLSGDIIKFRRTQLHGGLQLIGGDDLTLDLGNDVDPGQNTIDTIGACIVDDRPARPAPDGPLITLVGTKLNGQLFPVGSIITGPATSLPFYSISGTNNRISF